MSLAPPPRVLIHELPPTPNTRRHHGERLDHPANGAGSPDDSLAIIAPDPGGETCTQHYFESRGVVRIYKMSFRDGVWTLLRDAPDFTPLDFSQRFVGQLAPDGQTIDGAWETSTDRLGWERDFGLLYTKVD